MEGWNFWWGVVAFFLGGIATQLNGWLDYRRQRKDRADDAADALRQRREEFELQHLVEVNQLLRDSMRHLNVFLAFKRRIIESAAQNDQLDEAAGEAAQAYHEASAAVRAQAGFILDDHVRALVAEALALMDLAEVTRVSSPPIELMQALTDAGDKAIDAHEVLSARVRALYAGRAGA